MVSRKTFWVIFTLLLYLVTAGSFYTLGSRIQTSKNTIEASPSRPLGEGGLLVVAVAVNDLSQSLNATVIKENPELPPIKLLDSSSSYKTADSWMSIGSDVIMVFLYRDVSSALTKDELRAVVLHEVGHAKLKHSEDRVLKQEIEADLFSFHFGASPTALISAIRKLSPNSDEREERIKALEQLG